ncbi:HlyD family secretion protein [Paracoccus sp. (in: a-proteobacteria)]|uniref:HlyD family secretion protein n=1 Tax=Paracoccus sp. TaxID=267 RepID=UPI003A86F203
MTGYLCALPFAASLFTPCAAPEPFATGYVEGEYTLIAPVEIAQIEAVMTGRGARIAAGAPLIEMERQDAEIALAQAQAALAQAESELANLREGKRPEEISVIEAALVSARSNAAEAQRTAERIASLAGRGAATRTEREDAATAAEIAAAKVNEIEANLAVARLPARDWEISAKEAGVRRAQAELDQAQWKLDKRRITAPAAGTVQDVIRHAGEIAGPSAPVLSMLADDAVRLRLYVPESSVAAIGIGSRLAVGCDGCTQGIEALVTYIADGPEFTPPVIYSLQNRQKLVYLIEARPADGSELKPGQIVDVRLPEAPQ